MSFTYGFYNSVNHDRVYDATQFGQMFDGFINDGVYSSIGNCFKVSASGGMVVSIGTGRAWFNRTWCYNDSVLLLTDSGSEILLNRIDAVVIEVDQRSQTRATSLKFVKGTPSSNPVKPTLSNSDGLYQHPLAYITIESGTNEITEDNIESVIGTDECPFVTGIVQQVTITDLLTQWKAQWNTWFNSETAQDEIDFNNFLSNARTTFATWMANEQADFITWYNNLQVILDGDVATKLAEGILDLQNKFGILEKEYAVYSALEDEDSEIILDDNGTEISGRMIFVVKND